MDDIERAVHTFLVADVLADKPHVVLTESSPLLSEGLLDSLDALRLIGFLEDRYGITLDANEAGVVHMDTIRSVAALVRRKVR